MSLNQSINQSFDSFSPQQLLHVSLVQVIGTIHTAHSSDCFISTRTPTRVGQEVSPKLDSRGEVVALLPQVTEHSETPQLHTFSMEGDGMSMMEGGRWNERDGRSEMMAVINQWQVHIGEQFK